MNYYILVGIVILVLAALFIIWKQNHRPEQSKEKRDVVNCASSHSKNSKEADMKDIISAINKATAYNSSNTFDNLNVGTTLLVAFLVLFIGFTLIGPIADSVKGAFDTGEANVSTLNIGPITWGDMTAMDPIFLSFLIMIGGIILVFSLSSFGGCGVGIE